MLGSCILHLLYLQSALSDSRRKIGSCVSLQLTGVILHKVDGRTVETYLGDRHLWKSHPIAVMGIKETNNLDHILSTGFFHSLH